MADYSLETGDAVPPFPPKSNANELPAIDRPIKKILLYIAQSRFANWIRNLRQLQAHSDEVCRPTGPQNSTTNNPITSCPIRDMELGKFTLSLGIPITIAVLFSSSSSSHGKSHTFFLHFMLSLLIIGCATIWNGIFLRESFPRTSKFIEHLGIIVVFVSFSGLVASVFPPEFLCVPIICGSLFAVPIVLATLLASSSS